MIDDPLLAAIRARLTAALGPPRGPYTALRVEGHAIGWVNPERARRLAGFADVFVSTNGALMVRASLASDAARTGAFSEVARTLAAEGALTAWRDEPYAVAPSLGEPALFELERSSARYFGIVTYAAHVNGLAVHYGDVGMWLARRSPAKAIDPGQLDNLVGGGVRSGTTIKATVQREAWEEAGITAAVIERAQPVSAVHVRRELPDGLQREVIFVHDLRLPGNYTPLGVDGEAIDHRLATFPEAGRLIAAQDGPDVVTVDASLVILDCLIRHAAIPADSPHFLPLAALRMSSLAIAAAARAPMAADPR